MSQNTFLEAQQVITYICLNLHLDTNIFKLNPSLFIVTIVVRKYVSSTHDEIYQKLLRILKRITLYIKKCLQFLELYQITTLGLKWRAFIYLNPIYMNSSFPAVSPSALKLTKVQNNEASIDDWIIEKWRLNCTYWVHWAG